MTFSNGSFSTLLATYTSPTRINSRHCMPLAVQLLAAAPTTVSAFQKEALEALSMRAAEVDAVRMERERTSPPAVRGPRAALVAAWTALFDTLGAAATVPPEVDAAGPEAARLRAVLFPEGITFALLDAAAVWSQSRILLARIDDEGLGARLDAVAHASLRRAIAYQHELLSVVAGLDGKASTRGSTRALADAVARFSFAVAAYARALSVGLDPEDRSAVDRFVDALAPIDAFRVTGKSDTDDTEEPAPSPVLGGPSPVGPSPVGPTLDVPPPFPGA